MTEFVLKRREFYWAERIYTFLAVKLLPLLGKTALSPNMVTFFNLLNGLVIFWLVFREQYLVAAILIQVYLFLDILDGNLARFKNQCTTLGKVLDQIGDRLFYNGLYIVIALKINLEWEWLFAYLTIHNLYGIIATFYIVPHIRRLKEFKRSGVKKLMMSRGIILGMDLSTQAVITSVLLGTAYRKWIIIIITVLFFIDLVYRLSELWSNERTATLGENV